MASEEVDVDEATINNDDAADVNTELPDDLKSTGMDVVVVYEQDEEVQQSAQQEFESIKRGDQMLNKPSPHVVTRTNVPESNRKRIIKVHARKSYMQLKKEREEREAEEAETRKRQQAQHQIVMTLIEKINDDIQAGITATQVKNYMDDLRQALQHEDTNEEDKDALMDLISTLREEMTKNEDQSQLVDVQGTDENKSEEIEGSHSGGEILDKDVSTSAPSDDEKGVEPPNSPVVSVNIIDEDGNAVNLEEASNSLQHDDDIDSASSDAGGDSSAVSSSEEDGIAPNIAVDIPIEDTESKQISPHLAEAAGKGELTPEEIARQLKLARNKADVEFLTKLLKAQEDYENQKAAAQYERERNDKKKKKKTKKAKKKKYDKAELKKCLALVTPSTPVRAQCTTSRSLKTRDTYFLSFEMQEKLSALDINETPIGLWLCRNKKGKTGFVKTEHFQVDASEVLSRMSSMSTLPDSPLHHSIENPNFDANPLNIPSLSSTSAGVDMYASSTDEEN